MPGNRAWLWPNGPGHLAPRRLASMPMSTTASPPMNRNVKYRHGRHAARLLAPAWGGVGLDRASREMLHAQGLDFPGWQRRQLGILSALFRSTPSHPAFVLGPKPRHGHSDGPVTAAAVPRWPLRGSENTGINFVPRLDQGLGKAAAHVLDVTTKCSRRIKVAFKQFDHATQKNLT